MSSVMLIFTKYLAQQEKNERKENNRIAFKISAIKKIK